MSFEQEFDAYQKAHGTPSRIELMLVDMNGIIRGKWLDGKDAGKLSEGIARLPLSTYAPNIFGHEVDASGIGSVVGDPDGALFPVAGTLAPVPWADDNVAQVIVEMHEDDAPSMLSSREVLRRVGDAFGDAGLRPVIASELEFYLLQPRDNLRDAPLAPPNLPQAQNYELEVMEGQADVLAAIKDAGKALDLPMDTMIAEYGPGQFEINFHHTGDILAAADCAVLFRRMVRGVAARHGWQATFAAKPFLETPGNGMHLHASVLRDGKNTFDAKDGPNAALLSAVAGVISTMEEVQLIFAPHGNSYRRFVAGSFAPTVPNWGIDDRNVGIRLPQVTGAGARLEHRIAGADINPYLAFGAILAGMLHGIESKLIPPPAGEDAAPLTSVWENACASFERSDFAKTLLGDVLHRVMLAVKRDEIKEMQGEIPPLEYQAYIGRI